MSIRQILEEYKNKIHGSEYEYHQKYCTLDEHNEYMATSQYQAHQAILAELERMTLEKKIGIWEIETILRDCSVVEEGKELVIREVKFSDVCEKIKQLFDSKAIKKEGMNGN